MAHAPTDGKLRIDHDIGQWFAGQKGADVLRDMLLVILHEYNDPLEWVLTEDTDYTHFRRAMRMRLPKWFWSGEVYVFLRGMMDVARNKLRANYERTKEALELAQETCPRCGSGLSGHMSPDGITAWGCDSCERFARRPPVRVLFIPG